MNKNRLEAFSDGVLAIVITIMVLELKVPHGTGWKELLSVWPIFLSYALSFIMIATFWNNHHHMLQGAHHVGPAVMWANMHFLFWLSLLPFATGWMSENHFPAFPVAIYGFILTGSSLAYFILAKALVFRHGKNSVLGRAYGYNRKAVYSLVTLAIVTSLAFIHPGVAFGIYWVIAVFWIVPERRIEREIFGIVNLV